MLHAPSACTWLPHLDSKALTADLHLAHLPARRPLLAIHRQPAPAQSCRPQLHSQRSAGKCCAWGRGKRQPEAPKPGDNKTRPSQPDSDVSAANKQPSDQPSAQQSAQQNTKQNSQPGPLQNNSAGIVSIDSTPPAADRPKQNKHTNWEDWDDWDSDWEAPVDEQKPPDQFRKRNPRRGMGYAAPRDEYLRPMIDTLGIQYRLGFKQMEAEERVQTEFETNQWESREAVKFGGKC